MQQDDGAGVDPSRQDIKGVLPGGLCILIPVLVGQAPENGPVAQVLRPLQAAAAVAALGRAELFWHIPAGRLTVGVFHIRQFLFK